MTNTCPVEDALGMKKALELDAYLADPSGWPKGTFPKGFKVPRILPTSMRLWGATKLGIAWCQNEGIHTITKRQMQTHVREHVPFIIAVPSDAVEAAMVEDDGRRAVPAKQRRDVDLSNPITYQQVYLRGLALGDRAMELLAARIEKIIEDGGEVDTQTLMKIADLGSKMAQSQASLIIRGIGRQERDDEIEGFRAGTQPLPSERFGDHRIRVIEGMSRPIVDRGPADRQQYNERAEQEGSPTLPSP